MPRSGKKLLSDSLCDCFIEPCFGNSYVVDMSINGHVFIA